MAAIEPIEKAVAIDATRSDRLTRVDRLADVTVRDTNDPQDFDGSEI